MTLRLTKVSGTWTASKPIAPMATSASPVDLLWNVFCRGKQAAELGKRALR